MYGKDVQLDEVMVGLKYKEDQNYFDIRFMMNNFVLSTIILVTMLLYHDGADDR